MATRYVWMGYGAARMNEEIYWRLPKGFSCERAVGPPFRKIIDPAWKPVVSVVTDPMSPNDITPIPVKTQQRIEEAIKVRRYKDYYGSPIAEVPRHWFRRFLHSIFPWILDYVVFVTTDEDKDEPYVIYYRSRWVDN